MTYLIQENQSIVTPAVSDLLLSEGYKDQKKKRNHRLVAQIDSIHEGITKNYNKYTAEELRKAVPSWLTPYPKPILLNHNLDSEPLGRMVNSEFIVGPEEVGFIRLRANIADPLAASKVIDGRYLTGSVGGIPKAAICSICYADIIAASREGDRCPHNRGDIYEGKVCVYEHRDIEFHEYSFVNVPGDSESKIHSHVGESAFSEMALYDVDFDTQVVKEYRASDGIIDIREFMTESAAQKTYLDLAFGSKHAELYAQPEKSKNITFKQNISTIDEESGKSDLEQGLMTQKTETDNVVEHDEEDVLDVAARLATDLSESADSDADDTAVVEADEDADAGEAVSEEEAPAADETVEEDAEASAEDAAAEDPAVTEEVDEDKDLAETEEAADDAVEEAEASDTEEAAEDAVEAEVTEAEAETSEEEEALEAEESAKEADVTVLLERISELEAQNEKLLAQNKRMKEALHAELAEKVVDARIAVGHLSVDEREEALAEHLTRSASSLADALVDIRNFAEKNNYKVRVIDGTVPSLEIQAQATSESDESILLEENGESVEKEVVVDTEELLVANLSELLLNGVEKTLRKNSK
jgi:hypothetical protein